MYLLLSATVDVDDGTITSSKKRHPPKTRLRPRRPKSLLTDYRTARDRATSTVDTFPVNSRGEAASPQMIRRLIRIHGERSAVRDRVTP